MRRLRAPRFRRPVGALAFVGVVLNVWVLSVHITSVALKGLNATSNDVLICRRGGIGPIAGAEPGRPKPAPKAHCPICAGLASLNLILVKEEGLPLTIERAGPSQITLPSDRLLVDHRMWRTLNRGPPVLAWMTGAKRDV